jgi:hypothetical protein
MNVEKYCQTEVLATSKGDRRSHQYGFKKLPRVTYLGGWKEVLGPSWLDDGIAEHDGYGSREETFEA